MRAYASGVGASIEVITDPSNIAVPHEISTAWTEQLAIGRGNNTVYVLKMLAAAAALQKHDQVLLIDDTTYIKGHAADIFETCSAAALCAYSEGIATDIPAQQDTWNKSSEWLSKKGVQIRRQDYLNTGVMLFSREALSAWLSTARITRAMRIGLWKGFWPDQEYIAWVNTQHGLPSVQLLPEGFNCMLVRGDSSYWETPNSTVLLDAMANMSIHFLHVVRDDRKEKILQGNLPATIELMKHADADKDRYADIAHSAQYGNLTQPTCGRHVRLRQPQLDADGTLVPFPQVDYPEEDSWVVTYMSDGYFHTRCFVVQYPHQAPAAHGPLPVLLWFHGESDGAEGCGWREGSDDSYNLAERAYQKAIAVVCIEAVGYTGKPIGRATGQQQNRSLFWSIPERMSEATGTPCDPATDSRDLNMVIEVIKWLEAQPHKFNVSRLYLAGESAGAHTAQYMATCLHQSAQSRWKPLAFSAHSSGIKQQGDGVLLPRVPRLPWYHHGECPGCDFYPIVVSAQHPAPPVKACIFDSKQDGLMGTDGFMEYYKTSLVLAAKWREGGGKVDMTLNELGMHVQVNHWLDILTCLDDGTGQLLNPTINYQLPITPASDLPADQPIPKHVYTLWHGTPDEPMSEIVGACLATIRRQVARAGWTLHILDLQSPEVQLPSSVYPWKDLTDKRWVAHVADWIRLDVLERLGGVWLDASALMLAEPDMIFDIKKNHLQGFELSSYNPTGTMENWALASPPHNRLLKRWRDIFNDAVSQGLDTFAANFDLALLGGNCSEATVLSERWRQADWTSPASKFCRSLSPFMPYLSSNAAFRQAVHEMPGVAYTIMDAEVENGPMGYLAKHQTTDFTNRYDSVSAINEIFNESSSTGKLSGVPMLKLRAQERFATHRVSNLLDWAAKGSYLANIMVDELAHSPWSRSLGVQDSLATAGESDTPSVSLEAAVAPVSLLRPSDSSQSSQRSQRSQRQQQRKGGEPQAIVPTGLL